MGILKIKIQNEINTQILKTNIDGKQVHVAQW